jgi:hypothetical protein
MKTTFRLETDEIKTILLSHLDKKFSALPPDRITFGELKVKSKQNYRATEFELGEVQLDVEVEIYVIPPSDPETI